MVTKLKILGTKYGIEITKPWNAKMYEHNDIVSTQMKLNLKLAMVESYMNDDEETLRKIGRGINPARFDASYSFSNIYDNLQVELANVENYWLNNEYKHLAEAGLVPELPQYFIGYD